MHGVPWQRENEVSAKREIKERTCESCYGSGREKIAPRERLFAAKFLGDKQEGNRISVQHSGPEGGSPIPLYAIRVRFCESQMQPTAIEPLIDFPEPFEFLFEPHRYKGCRGGRGKGASWNFARALLILGGGEVEGYERALRILCARETQKSIQDSVHALLGDQIKAMGLEGFYEVQQSDHPRPGEWQRIYLCRPQAQRQ